MTNFTDFEVKPILITGCARSGTSMTAGIIDHCGAFGGNTSGPNINNPKGMFENMAIRNKIVKPFLSSIKADPLGQKPLPDMDLLYKLKRKDGLDLRDRVLSVLKEEGYRGGPWYYKGAKMCLMWPLWYLAFPYAKWIIVRRDSMDIVRSCMRTSFMRAYGNDKGWLQWIDFHKERFIEMFFTGLDISMLWPQVAIDGNLAEVKFVISKMNKDYGYGLRFNKRVVKDFIEPRLWKRWSDG